MVLTSFMIDPICLAFGCFDTLLKAELVRLDVLESAQRTADADGVLIQPDTVSHLAGSEKVGSQQGEEEKDRPTEGEPDF